MEFGLGSKLPVAGLPNHLADRCPRGSAGGAARVRLTARAVRSAVWICTRTSARLTPMGKTVLIVDDHPSFRASARRMLEADGYMVLGESEGGAAALAATQRLRPDLVLLDVRLPDMDGFEVTRRLLDANGHTP